MVVQTSPVLDTLLSSTAIPIPSKSNSSNRYYIKQQNIDELSPSLVSVLSAKKNGLNNCASQSVSENNSILNSSCSLSYNSTISSTTTFHPLSCSFDSIYDNDDESSSQDEYSMIDSIYDDINSINSVSSNSQKSRKLKSSLSLNKIIENNKINSSSTQPKSLMSNLTKSIKNFTIAATQLSKKQSSLAIQSLNFEPRSTDDKLPTINRPQHNEIQLKTYNIQNKPIHITTVHTQTYTACSTTQSSIIMKTRESRVNSLFLRMYSHDCRSRQLGYLPTIDALDEFRLRNHSIHSPEYREVLRISKISRDKLWNNVMLDAREDLPIKIHIDNETYKFTGNDEELVDGSVIRVNGDCLPWTNLKTDLNFKSFKPNGYLDNNRQFTVKGWTNPKWISI